MLEHAIDNEPAFEPLLLRKIKNEIMRSFRSVPRERRAQHVVLTKTEVEADADFILKSLPHSEQEFWIRSRRLARELVAIDKRAGGGGFAVTYEYRRCLVCRRLLIGAEAAAYRERCRYPVKTFQFKQGPVCSPDCKPERGYLNERHSRND